ncbi:MAG: hypothetical protein JST04_12750 [Bdellovibrionales bacterium]|nr:hypothetical protein [Bdellovibrionales bacterium]
MKNKTSDFYYLTLVWVIALVLQGCATQGKSIALGGGIGASAGALIGGIADPGRNGEYRTRNVIIGSALGGVAGIATGALVHDSSEEKQKEAYLAGQKSVKNRPPLPDGPGLTTPAVKVDWVEGRAVGNKWVDGHYERTITEGIRWETEKE